MDVNLKGLLDRQIGEIEAHIEQTIISDDEMLQAAEILRSVPGIGPVTTSMLIAEMPELGQITGEQAAALTGLAPIAHDSEAMRGKRAIGGGWRLLRHVMFQAALVASNHNPELRTFAKRLRAAGKSHKVIVTAVARRLITIAKALCKSRQKWATQADRGIQLLIIWAQVWAQDPLISAVPRDSSLRKRAVKMSGPLWLCEDQMVRLEPLSAKSHGKRRVDD